MTDSKKSLWSRLYQYKIHHVILWIAYFIFWIFVYKDYYESLSLLMVVTSIYLVFNAFAFYSIVYYLLPRHLYHRRYILFFTLFIAILLFSASGLTAALFVILKGQGPEMTAGFVEIFSQAFIAIGILVGVLTAAKLIIEKIISEQERRLREQERLATELQYLKAQVNPHFLFNAINSVYFLIRKNPDHAAETLIRLSDLLRFQLYDCSEDSIAIEKELEYLNNFITLERLRKGEKVKVDVRHEGELAGFQIAPFLLIPFFENAFKYVSNFSHTENRIGITLKRYNQIFTAEVFNTTDNLAKSDVGGIGLKNVKRRLELLYPDRHKLDITDEDGCYSVQLSLTIS